MYSLSKKENPSKYYNHSKTNLKNHIYKVKKFKLKYPNRDKL